MPDGMSIQTKSKLAMAGQKRSANSRRTAGDSSIVQYMVVSIDAVAKRRGKGRPRKARTSPFQAGMVQRSPSRACSGCST